MRHYLGISDAEFIRSKQVPMTKKEVRILTLVKAQVPVDGVVWDIGAGTGSLSIEAANLCPQGKVWAIEKRPEAISLLRLNIANLAVPNIGIIAAEAPEGLEKIPAPDCVLIGGSGGKLEEILQAVSARLRPRGRIVLNCVTVQTMYSALQWFREHEVQYDYEAVQVQVSQIKRVGRYDMLQADNPICIITATPKRPMEVA